MGRKIPIAARLLRREIRRLQHGFHYGFDQLSKNPTLFANGFPKSGTHLLIQVLKGFPNLGAVVDSGLPAVTMFDGYTGERLPIGEILKQLKRLKNGDIAYGHLHAEEDIIHLLQNRKFATYFIYRDPRDVVVSHVHYVAELAPNHVLHPFYQDFLPDFESRLSASIAGLDQQTLSKAYSSGQNNHTPPSLPDIRARFEPYLHWIELPDVCCIKFEELISDAEATIEKIYGFAIQQGFSSSIAWDKAIQILKANINPQASPTYREGKIGSWKKAFSETHKELFKSLANELLVILGYENDTNW